MMRGILLIPSTLPRPKVKALESDPFSDFFYTISAQHAGLTQDTLGEGKKSKKVLAKPKLGQMRDTNQKPDAYKEFLESSK